MKMSEKIKIFNKRRFLNRKAAILILRLILGGIFIHASIHKIINTTQFKNAITEYEILPYWLINIAAILLPWLEFWIGVFLILGIFVRSCAIMQAKLLLIFILAIGLNIARGLEFSCSCFAPATSSNDMNYFHIIFNTFWLFMAAMLFILERRRFSHRFIGLQKTK